MKKLAAITVAALLLFAFVATTHRAPPLQFAHPVTIELDTIAFTRHEVEVALVRGADLFGPHNVTVEPVIAHQDRGDFWTGRVTIEAERPPQVPLAPKLRPF